MGVVRMGRANDKSRVMLLLVVVVVVLIYLWVQDPNCSESDEVYGRSGRQPARTGDKRRFAMISMITKETSYDHIAISNKFYYAEKHGYHLRYDYWAPKVAWDKITNIENTIKEGKYDWVWWTDNDVLITNSTIRLEDVVDEALALAEEPDKIDMIVTPDCFELNDGSILFRSTPWVLELMKKVWQCGEKEIEPGRTPSEQDCIRDLIKDNVLGARDKAQHIKQWKINAFPEEIKCYDSDHRQWEPGMFVVHFAGAWAHMKNTNDPTGDLMRKYHAYAV